ncbi:MAG: GMC family oxidoreductase N-terminal domain-containing protein [Rhodocyclales bacterium]|nr:GMC family oxidoreductase N-terminal domain-containing protein [Rhodocyclales bacterium]
MTKDGVQYSLAGEFDFVVVGGGSAGCAVAGRLAEEHGATVALLEAGPRDWSPFVHVPAGVVATVPTRHCNWAFKTEPQAAFGGRRGYQPRGRVLGGSSAINAMIYTRGVPQDYDDWAVPGWSWDEVLPYFRRAEHNERGADHWHGVGGPLNVADLRSPNRVSRMFVEAAQACGHPRNDDFNGATQEGVGYYQVTQKDGRRWSAARAYLHGQANLAVLTDAQATRVLFDGKRATGVEIRRAGRHEVVRARREVVLSAGAFQSPQLLMLSGIGPADGLQALGIPVIHNSPQVGQNLQDHLDYVALYASRSLDLVGISLGGAVRVAAEAVRYLATRRGMLTTNYAEAGGFLKTDPALALPDIQLHFVIGLVDDHARKWRFGHGMSLHVCQLRPASRGAVTLASADPLARPQIDPRFLSAPGDLAALVKGVRIARRIMAGAALASVREAELMAPRDDSDAALEAAIRARADTIYHPAGTCRMGSDAASVVDAELRVRGVAGLRVADASIMPRLVAGNTNAPCVMIGEKAADLLRTAL